MLPHFGFAKDTGSFFPIFTIVLCAVYALFALGLNIVVGFAGLLDLGYVAFFLFGAYVAAWLMSDFGYQISHCRAGAVINIHFSRPRLSNTSPGSTSSFWLVVIVAGVVAAIAGVIIGAPTLRLKSDYLGPGDARLRRDPAGGLPQRDDVRRATTSPTARRESDRSTTSNGPARLHSRRSQRSSPRPTSRPSTT